MSKEEESHGQGEMTGMMHIWQNHETRITTLENTISSMQGEFREVKDIIAAGNKENRDRLETIDKRLMDEFFKKSSVNRENAWKLAMKITGFVLGTGGFAYVLIDIFFLRR